MHAYNWLLHLGENPKVSQLIANRIKHLMTVMCMTLMREPILQDKRQEHVKFQKHGLELLEQISSRI